MCIRVRLLALLINACYWMRRGGLGQFTGGFSGEAELEEPYFSFQEARVEQGAGAGMREVNKAAKLT